MSDLTISKTILSQLGGNKFVVMTGAKNFIGDENSLRMTLPKNMSKANRLTITLNWDDTYTMRFWKYTAGRLNSKTFEWIPEKITEIKEITGVYCDMLQEIFTETTGMYTRL